ncbi:hypothetical protein Trydic_g22068 [Trypoxylus dichotomus]
MISPQLLGGEDIVVEIYEGKFGKCKYHRGRAVEGQRVFGVYERGTGRVFMGGSDQAQLLLMNTGKHIVALDKKNISTWRDPESGKINAIDSLWMTAKAIIGSSVRLKAHIPGNLARYIFLKRWRELELDPSIEFFKLVGDLYNNYNTKADLEEASELIPKEEEEAAREGVEDELFS